jgi:hypothetical protein
MSRCSRACGCCDWAGLGFCLHVRRSQEVGDRRRLAFHRRSTHRTGSGALKEVYTCRYPLLWDCTKMTKKGCILVLHCLSRIPPGDVMFSPYCKHDNASYRYCIASQPHAGEGACVCRPIRPVCTWASSAWAWAWARPAQAASRKRERTPDGQAANAHGRGSIDERKDNPK